MSGIGFAIGLERLIMLLAALGREAADGPDFFIAALDESAVAESFKLVQELRRLNQWVETEYSSASVKSLMRRAGKIGASRVVIIGPDELARGELTVKNMSKGWQKNVPYHSADVSATAEALVRLAGQADEGETT